MPEPTNTAAWLDAPRAALTVRTAPYTHPQEDEIVVRNHALATNPVDCALQLLGTRLFRWLKYPLILGSDVAGEVVEIGAGVTRFKIGDRVLGFALGTDRARGNTSEGAFQEYTVLLERTTVPIPDTLPYENASTLPLTLSTAASGLFQQDELALQYPSVTPQSTGQALLIWGGSTGVGSNAIQLAVAAGYEVITTASPRNFDYVRKLGASQVFDYKDASTGEKIIATLKGKTLAGALAVGAGSADACSRIVSVSAGKKIVACVSGTSSVGLSDFPEHPGLNSQTLLTIARYVLSNVSTPLKIRSRHVRTTSVWGSSLINNEVGKVIYEDFLPQALAQGRYIAAPEPLVIGEGLDQLQTALDAQRRGVSACKIVVTL